jgi:hypothetical protein
MTLAFSARDLLLIVFVFVQFSAFVNWTIINCSHVKFPLPPSAYLIRKQDFTLLRHAIYSTNSNV